MTLSHEALQEFGDRGFVVARGLVDAAEREALGRDLSARITAAGRARAAGETAEFWAQMARSPHSAEVFFEEGAEPTESRVMRVGHGLHLGGGPFAELSLESRVARGLAELVAPPARVVSCAVVYKQPKSDVVQFGFHQDASYLTFSPPSLVLAFVALDRCDAESGALQVVPGSHRRGVELRLRLGARGFERVSGREARHGAGEAELLELAPGDVAFVDGCAYHASDPNRSEHPRRAIIVHAVGGDAAAEASTWLGPPEGGYARVRV